MSELRRVLLAATKTGIKEHALNLNFDMVGSPNPVRFVYDADGSVRSCVSAYRYLMITRRDAAQRLDIPLEMAQRHGIPARMSEAELDEFEQNPPARLVQSRANRKSTTRPTWVQLKCDVCGFTESARPKKWWPAFTYLSCAEHGIWELPEAAAGLYREEFDGIGSRFVGIVDRA